MNVLVTSKEQSMRGIRYMIAAAALTASMAPMAEARPRPSADSVVVTSQNGDDNVAIVRQFGNADRAVLVQTGDGATACAVQVGDNLSLNLSQRGGESASVMQNPGRTHDVPLQACLSMHGGRRATR